MGYIEMQLTGLKSSSQYDTGHILELCKTIYIKEGVFGNGCG